MLNATHRIAILAVTIAAAQLFHSDAPAEPKGIVLSTLSVAVSNEYDRLLGGANLTLANEGVSVTGTHADGAYTFPPVSTGVYTLSAEAPFFQDDTVTIELSGATESASMVLQLDDTQFPQELLDDFREFDADLNGEIGETEFVSTFPGALDAWLTYRDRCACALTPRHLAALFGRPFLSVSPTKATADGAYPTGAIDFGEVIENTAATIEIVVANDGGARLTGNLTFEDHGGASITSSPANYALNAGSATTVDVVLAPRNIGTFSGILRLSGNYDGQPLALAVSGTVIEGGGEGEGEGEGEVPACRFTASESSLAAIGDPWILIIVVALLLFPHRGRKQRE